MNHFDGHLATEIVCKLRRAKNVFRGKLFCLSVCVSVTYPSLHLPALRVGPCIYHPFQRGNSSPSPPTLWPTPSRFGPYIGHSHPSICILGPGGYGPTMKMNWNGGPWEVGWRHQSASSLLHQRGETRKPHCSSSPVPLTGDPWPVKEAERKIRKIKINWFWLGTLPERKSAERRFGNQ